MLPTSQRVRSTNSYWDKPSSTWCSSVSRKPGGALATSKDLQTGTRDQAVLGLDPGAFLTRRPSNGFMPRRSPRLHLNGSPVGDWIRIPTWALSQGRGPWTPGRPGKRIQEPELPSGAQLTVSIAPIIGRGSTEYSNKTEEMLASRPRVIYKTLTVGQVVCTHYSEPSA